MGVEHRIYQQLDYEFFDDAFGFHQGFPADIADTVGAAFCAACDKHDDERRERMRAAIAAYIWDNDCAEDLLAVADLIRQRQAE